ncbi:hypothetical protein JW796_00640 [Candidatus Dojkabacteria bacterium]|nr:hypothetical protein [Candidatus Dojkabacteria bacterium]
MTDETPLKKLEELENEIEKIISRKGFVTFVHLKKRKNIKSVWIKAVNFIDTKLKNSESDKAAFNKYLTEFHGLVSNINVADEWVHWQEIEAIYESSKRISPESSEFLLALTKVHLLRKKNVLPELGEYSLVSTIEIDTQRIRIAKGLSIISPNVSLILDGKDFLLTDKEGNFNLTTTLGIEKKECNIVSTLSTLAHIPSLQDTILDEIQNVSKHPFIYDLYPEKAKRALWAATKHLTLFASRFAHNQLNRGIGLSEAVENTQEYMKSIPDLEPDMYLEMKESGLWESIRLGLISEEKIDPVDVKIMFSEILEAMVYLCRSAGIVPSKFFDIEFRESSDEEKSIEGNKFSMDVFELDEGGKRSDYIIETYAVVLTPESEVSIVDSVTNGKLNTDFYPKFDNRSIAEKIEDYLTVPVNEKEDFINYIE